MTILYPDNPGHVALDMLVWSVKTCGGAGRNSAVDYQIIGDYFNDEGFQNQLSELAESTLAEKDQAISGFYHQPQAARAENALC